MRFGLLAMLAVVAMTAATRAGSFDYHSTPLSVSLSGDTLTASDPSGAIQIVENGVDLGSHFGSTLTFTALLTPDHQSALNAHLTLDVGNGTVIDATDLSNAVVRLDTLGMARFFFSDFTKNSSPVSQGLEYRIDLSGFSLPDSGAASDTISPPTPLPSSASLGCLLFLGVGAVGILRRRASKAEAA